MIYFRVNTWCIAKNISIKHLFLLQPDTVPQSSVDMTSVLEVSEADSVTGHAHSLAITAPERVTFVKGTSREEARWWADVLAVYPRSKVIFTFNFVGFNPKSMQGWYILSCCYVNYIYHQAVSFIVNTKSIHNCNGHHVSRFTHTFLHQQSIDLSTTPHTLESQPSTLIDFLSRQIAENYCSRIGKCGIRICGVTDGDG